MCMIVNIDTILIMYLFTLGITCIGLCYCATLSFWWSIEWMIMIAIVSLQVEQTIPEIIPRWDANNPLCPRVTRPSGKVCSSLFCVIIRNITDIHVDYEITLSTLSPSGEWWLQKHFCFHERFPCSLPGRSSSRYLYMQFNFCFVKINDCSSLFLLLIFCFLSCLSGPSKHPLLQSGQAQGTWWVSHQRVK